MIFLVGLISAGDWTPYGDINLRDTYSIKEGIDGDFQTINLSGRLDVDNILAHNNITTTENFIGYQIGNTSLWSGDSGNVWPTFWDRPGFNTFQLGLGTNDPEVVLDIFDFQPTVKIRGTGATQTSMLQMGDSFVDNNFMIVAYPTSWSVAGLRNSAHIFSLGDMWIDSGMGIINITDDTEIQGDLDVNGELSALNISGIMSWSNLTDYPVACPAGTSITQLDDSVTCTAFAQENTNVTFKNITGDNLYLNENGVIDGNFDVDGNFTGNQIYGGMWYHNHTGTTLSFSVQDTWYPLYYTTATDLNGFSYVGGFGLSSNLTAQVSGKYQASYMGIGSGQNNHVYLTTILVDGVEKPECGNHHKMAAGGDVITQSGVCIITINAGDTVQVATQDMGGTGDGVYYGGNLNLVRIGNG